MEIPSCRQSVFIGTYSSNLKYTSDSKTLLQQCGIRRSCTYCWQRHTHTHTQNLRYL